MKKLDSMQALYVDQLRDLRSAEAQLVEALPKAAKAAASPDLKAAIQEHLDVTREQLARVDALLEGLAEGRSRATCKGMAGLIKEANETLEADGDPQVRDAGLIAAAQRIEHYEIAGYGCAAAYAELLGDGAAAAELRMSLKEERVADTVLNDLAQKVVNPAAAEGEAEPAEDDEAEDEDGKQPNAGGRRSTRPAKRRGRANARVE